MIIRRIRMINFRGFHDKTINFGDKSVVLLTAANGIGKTTTIDAIEWCLTGDIRRLKTAFDIRSTNNSDRKQNTNGILKNRDASDDAKIQVFLWMVEDDNETTLCREQKKDELNPSASKVTINGSESMAKEFIEKYVGNSFYNFHFCDIQKSFSVQSTKRRNLEAFFSEFITNYDEQKQIAESLDVFVKDVERFIEDKSGEKVLQEIIKNQEEQLAREQEKIKKFSYAESVFCTDENFEIASLSRDRVIEQREKLENYGYLIVEKEINKLIENDALKNQKSLIKNINYFLKNKEYSIRRALNLGLFYNSDVIKKPIIKLEQLKRLSFTNDSILQDVDLLIRYGVVNVLKKADFDADIMNIKEKEKKIMDISSEVDLLSGNNKMLKLLSSLTANRQVVIEHRNTTLAETGVVRCPVCGSEAFALMDESLILKEADNYAKQNGELVLIKEKEKKALRVDVEALYQKLITRAKDIVKKEQENLAVEIRELQDLYDEIKPYVDAVNKLQIDKKDFRIEELDSKKIATLQAIVENKLLTETKEKEAIELYQKILKVLGYVFENETVQQTYEKVKNLITKQYEVDNFTYETFVSKLNAIDSILANQTISDLSKKLEDDKNKNQIIDSEIIELSELKNLASQKAINIREVVEKLSKAEYEKIGPTLRRLYNKLIRFEDGEGINIVQENDGISLVDDKGKNIVNVLSNGQINVFMLAYFFAGINARNEREKMKIFFIDDLTACMDDVNMLAFLDLLKYQMSSKKTMEQLFFVTCDVRISKLLKYKLAGRGIALQEVLEKDLV